MLSSRLGGFSLVAAAPVILAAELVRSDHSQEKYGPQLADVAASRTPELLAAALFLLGAILLVPAAIGIAKLAHGRGARLIAIGSVLLGIASIWLAAGRAMFCLMLYALSGENVPRATAVAALERIGNSGGFSMFLISLAAMLLAPIVLGFGLWRADQAPWWLPAVWVATHDRRVSRRRDEQARRPRRLRRDDGRADGNRRGRDRRAPGGGDGVGRRSHADATSGNRRQSTRLCSACRASPRGAARGRRRRPAAPRRRSRGRRRRSSRTRADGRAGTARPRPSRPWRAGRLRRAA